MLTQAMKLKNFTVSRESKEICILPEVYQE
jgi:hypothetical protein